MSVKSEAPSSQWKAIQTNDIARTLEVYVTFCVSRVMHWKKPFCFFFSTRQYSSTEIHKNNHISSIWLGLFILHEWLLCYSYSRNLTTPFKIPFLNSKWFNTLLIIVCKTSVTVKPKISSFVFQYLVIYMLASYGNTCFQSAIKFCMSQYMYMHSKFLPCLLFFMCMCIH